MLRWALAVARSALDLVLPPLCLSCKAVVAEPGSLCAQCWSKITFLAPPHCAACGHPLEIDLGPDALCGACVEDPFPFRRARAVFRYDDASKSLILRFKHADRLEGAHAFARWMARAGAQLIEQADMIVPVPLHRWRLWSRRYNQAAILALGLGEQARRPVETGVLTRPRKTPPQGRLGRADRARNVRGAFAVPDAARAKIQGKSILLVDDVMTTGATLATCTDALKRAGAAHVDVLTLARVVK